MDRSCLDKVQDRYIRTSIGYFQITFKHGEIILIAKDGKDFANPINYRPITLLEVFGKVMERIITNRFSQYLEMNNLLPMHQYGFRRGRGTETAITTIYETIAMAQRNNFQTNVVCRDISKAFDKIWHDGLKYKICHLNLPSIFEKILANFLDERSAALKIDGMV